MFRGKVEKKLIHFLKLKIVNNWENWGLVLIINDIALLNLKVKENKFNLGLSNYHVLIINKQNGKFNPSITNSLLTIEIYQYVPIKALALYFYTTRFIETLKSLGKWSLKYKKTFKDNSWDHSTLSTILYLKDSIV